MSALGNLTLSQTSVSINAGSSMTISAYTINGQVVNLVSVTNSAVAYANVSGNQITIYGLSNGFTQMNFCTYDNSCATVSVNVGSGNGNYGQITFGQNNLNITQNQSINVSVLNTAGGSIYISNNSNTSAVSASISNNILTVTGINMGSSSITICGSNASCGILNVTVTGSNQISFSQNNINLNIGQNQFVNIYSTQYSPSYYISNNTNSNAVSASVSGSSLSVYGQNNGSSNITVCATNSQCATLLVNVTGNNQGNLSFTNLSFPQPRVNQYYAFQIGVTGGNAPYNFYMNSGNLPSGLFLSNSGLVYGTPTNTQSTSFSVRVNDNFSRSLVSQTLVLTPTGNIAGALIYNNGTLINDAGTIYITYKNTKSAFTNINAFNGLGYKLSNVINANTASVNFTGYLITTSNAAHPWGSWVKNNGTIYFMHESGLIPIPTMDIFTSNGGDLRNVVDMNPYDFNRGTQSQMDYNDWRLK